MALPHRNDRQGIWVVRICALKIRVLIRYTAFTCLTIRTATCIETVSWFKKWDNRLLTETFTEEAIRVIREVRKALLPLRAWSAPHFPADPHPEWHGNSGERVREVLMV